MRVIAGKARRMNLKSLKGLDTRPTLDRYKETLFNTIQTYVPDCLFLDVFAGCGGIGIEALSRGARQCYFIENNRNAAQVIRENLEKTGLMPQAEVLNADAITGMQQLEHLFSRNHKGPFDVIYLDPPYHKRLEESALRFLSHSSIAGPDSIIIVEASNDTAFDYVEEIGLCLTKTKDYKTNRHLFFVKRQGEDN